MSGSLRWLHVGKFPDAGGKMHDLVIREGQLGLWQNDAPVPDQSSDERFWEVVTNRKLISQVCTPNPQGLCPHGRGEAGKRHTSAASSSMMVATLTVGVPVGNFISSSRAHADYFNFVVQGSARIRVVGVNVDIEASGLDDQCVTNALRGLDCNNFTGPEFFLLLPQVQMFDGDTLYCIRATRAIGLMRLQGDRNFITSRLAHHCLLQPGNHIGMAMQVQ